MARQNQRRLEKRLVNQIRHMALQAQRLHQQVDLMCPIEFQQGQRIDDEDSIACEWNNAHIASFALADALTSLVMELEPTQALPDAG